MRSDPLKVLERYLNTGTVSRSGKLLSFIFPGIASRIEAEKVKKACFPPEKSPDTRAQQIQIDVELYNGKNAHVRQMMSYLERHLKNDLLGAYIHGSLGTGEEIPYSDFDALVIIRNEVLDTPRRLALVGRKIRKALSIMYDRDPLQHHGWFSLTENDLACYVDDYFPAELFRHSKALLPGQGLSLKINTLSSPSQYRAAFENLGSGIIEQVEKGKYPQNLYQLKSLLSRFMLLPALYVQARDNKAVFKKYSFEMAKTDFSRDDWSIMDEVSAIRENWSCDIPLLKRWVLTRTSFLWRSLAKKTAPSIPVYLQEKITAGFYERMKELARTMKRALG